MATNRVITTAGIITVAVGTVNAIAKDKRLPSTRFLIGSGVAFLIISALADVEPELASAFAIAVATTVVLGDGGGVLSYINTGEIDTQKKKGDHTPDAKGPPTNTNTHSFPESRPTIAFPGLTPRPNLG